MRSPNRSRVAARTSALAHDYPFLPQRTVRRLFRAYGTHAADVLGKARKREDLGQDDASVSRGTDADLAGVAAQAEDDAQRLRALGAHDVVVTGNLKFDVTLLNCRQPMTILLWFVGSTAIEHSLAASPVMFCPCPLTFT